MSKIATSKPFPRTNEPTWFLRRRGYVAFMIREATSFVLAVYLVVLVIFFARLGAGPQAFAEHMVALTSPGWIALHVLAFIAACWHSITWWNLSPKAMPLRRGENKVSDPIAAILTGYLPWLVISVIIIYFAMP